MPGILLSARQHSADDIPFPAKSSRTRGEIRHKLHEYPRQAGANTEKQGRKVWVWTVEVPVHEKFPRYPNLFPDTLNKLRKLFQDETTFNFTHPVDGSYAAWITDWDQLLDGKVTSGLGLTLTIQEDNNDQFLIRDIAAFNAVNAAKNWLADDIYAAQLALNQEGARDESLFAPFDRIIAGAQEVFKHFDQASLSASLIDAKIQALIDLVKQVDATSRLLQNPDAYRVVHSLGQLMTALVDIHTNPGGIFDHKEYTVPIEMSIGEISTAIYGDATHVSDLLSLNILDDATAVPAGTKIRFL